ncbi:MAG: hypothetical protein R3C44_19425 [Chloroflexota bacterium]
MGWLWWGLVVAGRPASDAPDCPPPAVELPSSNGANGLINSLQKELSSAGNTARRTTKRAWNLSKRFINDFRPPNQPLPPEGMSPCREPDYFCELDDPGTVFKGQLGALKRAAWTRPIPLEDVKFIKNSTRRHRERCAGDGVTGGLRRYLSGARSAG